MGSRVSSTKNNLQIIVINVYGPTLAIEKLVVWNEINTFLSTLQNENIIIGGDFNTILKRDEKYGEIQTIPRATKDFREWTERNSLIDIPTKNGVYTWNNRRKDFSYIAEILDRFFFKGDLSSLEREINAEILPMMGSDHFLIKIEIKEPSKPSRNLFKCEKMWFIDKNFMNNIKNWWQEEKIQG